MLEKQCLTLRWTAKHAVSKMAFWLSLSFIVFLWMIKLLPEEEDPYE